jgi:signal transduction histidine kinase
MNIKLRLSFQFAVLMAGAAILFSVMVYYFSYSTQLNKFRENLTNRARNSAILLLNVKEIDAVLLNKIQRSTFYLKQEEIVITDTSFEVLYQLNMEYLNSEVVMEYGKCNTQCFFSINEKDGVVYRHRVDKLSFFVYVMAYDQSRRENLSDLRKVLIWSFIFSLWISILLAYLFSKTAIKPISDFISEVNKVTDTQLSKRLNEGNKKDEISQLAISFNEMIARLETSFRNQADFVSHASHELRTPLTIMISEADFLLSRERTREEYTLHIKGLIDDLKNLNRKVNSLLELAQLKRGEAVDMAVIRIDEMAFSAISTVKSRFPGRRIIPEITYPDDDSELLVSGNAGMLLIAFTNILDNACKFSGGDVKLIISTAPEAIRVSIADTGIGIPDEDFKNIFQPFNRASNVKFISGFGVGLAIVAKILDLHDAKITVHSKLSEGTRIEMLFRRITPA